MADPKNTNPTAKTETKAEAFDPTKYLPKGADPARLRKVGNLTPIWSAELAHKHGLVLAGDLDRYEVIDMGEEEEEKNRYRKMIRVVAAHPTKGVLGSKREQKIMDVGVGEDILLPISGSLKANKAVLACAWHPKQVFFGVFRVKGQIDTGRPSEMWEIEAFLTDQTKPRDGRFALPPAYVYSPKVGKHGDIIAHEPVGYLPNGQTFDADGVVHDRKQMTA